MQFDVESPRPNPERGVGPPRFLDLNISFSGIQVAEHMRLLHLSERERVRIFHSPQCTELEQELFRLALEVKALSDASLHNIISDPFSPQAQYFLSRLVSESHLDINYYDRIRIVYLAESDSEYEKSFPRARLKAEQNVSTELRQEQKETLLNHFSASADILHRLISHVIQHPDRFYTMSAKRVIKDFMHVAFSGKKDEQIFKENSLQQRRAVRMTALRFYQDLMDIQECRESVTLKNEAQKDSDMISRELAEDMLDISLPQHILGIKAKFYPFAVVFMLEPETYEQLSSGLGMGHGVEGMSLPAYKYWPALKGKIIIVRDDNASDSTEKTLAHELTHIFYSNYLMSAPLFDFAGHQKAIERLFSMEAANPEEVGEIKQEHRKLSRHLFEYSMEQALQEIIAFASEGQHFLSPIQMGATEWDSVPVLSSSDKANLRPEHLEIVKEVLSYYVAEQSKYFKALPFMQWVSKRLFDAIKNGESALHMQKVDAYLFLTNPEKITRLLDLLGIDIGTAKAQFMQDQASVIVQFNELVDRLGRGDFDEVTLRHWRETDIMSKVSAYYCPETIAPLLRLLLIRLDQEVVEQGCLLLEAILHAHSTDIDTANRRRIRDTLASVISSFAEPNAGIKHRAARIFRLLSSSK